MARTVTTSSTFEDWRQSYNDLAVDVGDPTSLTTADKSSVVNAINYIMDQYFYFQDFDFDGSDGATSNTVFSGQDNNGTTLAYMASKVLVYKNGLLLRSGTDYTAVNGTSVTLTSSANNGDVIRISSYTGSYTATPAGQESNYIWSTAGAIIHNRNDGGIVFNSDSTTDTTLDVANSFQFNGPVYAVEDVYINNQKDLRFKEGSGNGSNYVAVQAPASISTNRTLTLPDAEDGYMLAVAAVGSNGQVLSSDGDGSYSWTNVSNTNTTYGTSWVDSGDDAILRLTPSTGSNDDLTIVAGTGITITPSGDNLTIAQTSATNPTLITVADESSDTTCFPAFFTAATGDLGPKTGSNLTFNSSSGVLTATGFVGPLTGNVTGNASGTAATVTGGTQVAITSAANLATVGTITTGVWSGTALVSAKIGNDQIDSQHIAAGAIDDPAMMATGVVQIAKIDPSLIQLSSESFADNDTSLMTSAAVQDKILSYGYTTETGDITGVTAGSGMSGGGTSGTVTLTNAGVTSIVAGSNVSISGATGAVTVTSTDTNTTYSVGDGGLTTNDFTNADHSKLNAIEASATADQSNTEIRNAVEAASDSNTFTDADHSKLNAIEAGATADQTSVSGNAGTATALATGRTIGMTGDVVWTSASFTGSGNVTGSSVIQTDAVDIAMLSATGTASSSTFLRGDNSWVTPTNTTYTAGGATNSSNTAGIYLSGTTFELTSDYRDKGTLIWGNNTGDYIDYGVTADQMKFFIGTNERMRLTATDAHFDDDIVAFSASVSSDIVLKENINPISNALDKVIQLGGYTFDWKDKKRGSSTGLIAQEVEKILPELVKDQKGITNHKTLNYNGIIGLLVESIKELKTEIESLKNSKS